MCYHPKCQEWDAPDHEAWAKVGQTSLLKAERARQNRAYVRKLLQERQPEFAAALAAANEQIVVQHGQLLGRHDHAMAADWSAAGVARVDDRVRAERALAHRPSCRMGVPAWSGNVRASCTRLVTLSFRKILRRWYSTVLALMNSRAAISRLDR